MIKRTLFLLACLLPTGCATAPKGRPVTDVQVSEIPVAEPCAINPGPEPNFPDTPSAIAAAPDIFERAKLYASGRQMRLDWEALLEAANAGCRAMSRPSP